MIDFQRHKGDDRPKILLPDGSKHVYYTRASKLAKLLDDSKKLSDWQQRKVAQGLMLRPDLQTKMAGILATMNPDARIGKQAIDRLCHEAREAAKASAAASTGTGIHALTEAIDLGTPFAAPAHDQARLNAYIRASEGYTPLIIEGRVVNDELQAAGSFDRLWLCPDGKVRIGDLKTGKWDADYPLGVTIQLAIYAYGVLYNPEDDTRSPIHEDIDLDSALLWHLPEPEAGEEPVCSVIPLDIRQGIEIARVAKQVQGIRRLKAKDLFFGSVCNSDTQQSNEEDEE